MTAARRLQPWHWFVIGLACWLVGSVAFMVWAPWTTAITMAEATERYPEQVDPNWPAAMVSHGKPYEWTLGTIAENTAGFAVCTAVMALAVGGFVYCAYRCERLRRDEVR
jgi:hypothetical protein